MQHNAPQGAHWPARFVAIVLVGLTIGPIPLLLFRGTGSLQAADWAALRFTATQAALSAGLSCMLAIPLARALARRRFIGRSAMITLMGAPFLLPVIVAALGIVAVWGQRGWLADLGLPIPRLFGMTGVILAHVFLNLPLATRMILQGWQAIPSERLRLAESLGFDPTARFRHLEGPMLRAVLPGAALAIFLVCLASFTIALTLGGGPRATTLELAIYQAVRFEFDLPRAALLALLQFGACSLAVLLAVRLTQSTGFGAGLDRRLNLAAPSGWRRLCDGAILLVTLVFLGMPLVAAVFKGVQGLPELPQQVWPALANSLIIATVSMFLSISAALVLATAVANGRNRFDLLAMLPLASSSLVLGIGLFLLVFPWINPPRVAIPMTILINATLALPFAFRLLLPEARALQTDYGRLAASLGLRGLARLRVLTLPRLRRPLGFAAGLCAALAMGDIGAMALFATEHGVTLPLLVQRLMGAYRMEAAAAAALVLTIANFALFWAFDAWGRHHVDA